MPVPHEVDLTIPRVPYDVFARIERTAAHHGQTVEEFVLDQVEKLALPLPDDQRSMAEVLESIRARREQIAARGPFLKPGETFKDLAREGLRGA